MENFKFFFTSSDAWRVTRNTVGLNLIFICMGLLFSVAFALILNEITNKAFLKTYQTIMILPNFLSWVVISYMFFAFFNVQYGISNQILSKFGLEPIDWYSSPSYWPGLLTFTSIWKSTGWNSLIYYAILISIDSQYYEAAKIDGASKWQMIKNISIPFLTSTITILTILAIGNIFRSDFGMFFHLTRDNPLLYPTTDVIDTYVYRALKGYSTLGQTTAVGLYQSLVGFILIFITNTVVRKINPENSLF